jgi:hypothetical protein
VIPSFGADGGAWGVIAVAVAWPVALLEAIKRRSRP